MQENQNPTEELDLAKIIDNAPQQDNTKANVIFVGCILIIIAVIVFIGNPSQPQVISDQDLDAAAVKSAGQTKPQQGVAGAQDFGPIGPHAGKPTASPTPKTSATPTPLETPTLTPTQTPSPTSAPSSPTSTPQPTNTPEPTQTPTNTPEPTPGA